MQKFYLKSIDIKLNNWNVIFFPFVWVYDLFVRKDKDYFWTIHGTVFMVLYMFFGLFTGLCVGWDIINISFFPLRVLAYVATGAVGVLGFGLFGVLLSGIITVVDD